MQGDTHYQMSRDYYYDLLLGAGFEKVFSYNFKDAENKKEEFSLWFEKNRGLLVKAETYGSYDNNKTINSTNLYCEIEIPDTLDKLDELQASSFHDLLWDRTHGSCDAPGCMGKVFYVSTDVREGLFSFIDKLDASGFKMNNPWKYPASKHDLWLHDYMEAKEKDYDYKKTRDKKLSQLPEKVKKAINFSE